MKVFLALLALNFHCYSTRQTQIPNSVNQHQPVTEVICTKSCASTGSVLDRQPSTKATKAVSTISSSAITTSRNETQGTLYPTTVTVTDSTSPLTTQKLDSNVHVCTNQYEVTVTVLGIVICLLMIILAAAITGWAWTCWLLKRAAKKNYLMEQDRAHSVHNLRYRTNIRKLSLENNSEQLPGQTVTTRMNNGRCDSLGEEEVGDSQENVYHILENPGDNDDYEDLDKYELDKMAQKQEENVYHILDGPMVTEERPEGMAMLTPNESTPEDHDSEIPILELGSSCQ